MSEKKPMSEQELREAAITLIKMKRGFKKMLNQTPNPNSQETK